jgi:ferredoxin
VIWLDLALLIGTSVPLLLLIHASIGERAWRAALLGSVGLLVNVLLWVSLILFVDRPGVGAATTAIAGVLAAFAIVSVLPARVRRRAMVLSGLRRFDERDHMFARNNLRRHPALADRYYAEHPEARPVDERIGKRPELGQPGGRYYDPALTPIATAAFEMLDRSRHLAVGEAAESKTVVGSGELTRRLLQIGSVYGAVDVGVTRLEDRHVYGFRGRHAERWGEAVEREHSHAVVIVVAMDHGAIARAPDAPAMVESSRQYIESARIAHVMAAYLRGLGYAARSHVDGNYEVLCVPLAADAGLGEIGRMSIFMHHVYGPCVRIAVVTTDAPLEETRRVASGHVEAFCDICKKCSDNCPSRAIPSGAPTESRGFLHWSVDQEACYGTWRAFGSDCAVCIRVCPFTKPDTTIHRIARWYVSRNGLNRRIALWADDLLYGRRMKLPPGRRGVS